MEYLENKLTKIEVGSNVQRGYNELERILKEVVNKYGKKEENISTHENSGNKRNNREKRETEE